MGNPHRANRGGFRRMGVLAGVWVLGGVGGAAAFPPGYLGPEEAEGRGDKVSGGGWPLGAVASCPAQAEALGVGKRHEFEAKTI